jgi:tetratricopeptide (TPR) repeat protein
MIAAVSQRPALEVADVIRQYGDDFLGRYGDMLSAAQHKALRDLRMCRTAALGQVGDDFGALVHQVHAAAKQIAGFAQALGIGVRHGQVAAAQQLGDLFGIDLVVLGFAAVDGLHVQGVAQHESDALCLAQVGEPIPAELDLETVCLKAMDKDPDRRYQTAGELAADLRRFLNRFAIAARRAGPVERLRKWVKRHPGIAASLALVVAAVGAAGYFGYRAHVAEQTRLADQERHDDELAAERQQHALDKAIEAAMSGEVGRANRAIREAELIGVARGQVCWLRGLVHHQRSEYGPAIEEFGQAVALMPASVAARALLARSHLMAGLYGGQGITSTSLDMLAEMRRLTPTTPEDYLCRGYALGFFQPVEAMADLDKAVELRDSPIARAFRAIAGNRIAMEFGDLPKAERAVADIQRAKVLLGENTTVRAWSIHCHLTAAHLYGEAGQADKRLAALEEARRDALALEHSHVPEHVIARAYYFEQVADEAEALKIYGDAVEREGVTQLVSRYAMALYRRGEVVEALKTLDPQKGPRDRASDNLRAFLLAEHPDFGPTKVEENCRELLARREYTGMTNASAVLLFLQKRHEAADLSRHLQPPPEFLVFSLFDLKVADYLAGKVSEEEFLLIPGNRRFGQCSVHFWVGLARLSEGDRKGAREHFEKVIATGVFIHLVYPYCRTFLARMKQDDKWPRWIPAKE